MFFKFRIDKYVSPYASNIKKGRITHKTYLHPPPRSDDSDCRVGSLANVRSSRTTPRKTKKVEVSIE